MALRKPRNVSFGFDAIPQKVEIGNDLSSAEIVFKSGNTGKCGLLVVLKPDCQYEVQIPERVHQVRTDKFGLMSLEIASCDLDSVIKISILEGRTARQN